MVQFDIIIHANIRMKIFAFKVLKPYEVISNIVYTNSKSESDMVDLITHYIKAICQNSL